ncbi:tyrosine protein phosphatase [Candidatus Williamhamiltonella defendens]|uniref:Tyrosine-protein phosphatase n=1 Tax=Hamiltonella defensa subsp. Acyrthosiphon pisum (strain 5AT) TaxID=572265 RepID=C4K3L1_HAMD5|nr:protein-tyrosine phosphatase family protein [Candidatus Hamiltonella defensa]ACQ67154.1 putative tyrosine-protein phosphatase [Candidatus Hamiltonella defensa 5AT (Acyrthosiphon pisum)]ATW21925.1 tyrosine protein phosphatase [Candidatus Hamiltonella defensa]
MHRVNHLSTHPSYENTASTQSTGSSLPRELSSVKNINHSKSMHYISRLQNLLDFCSKENDKKRILREREGKFRAALLTKDTPTDTEKKANESVLNFVKGYQVDYNCLKSNMSKEDIKNLVFQKTDDNKVLIIDTKSQKISCGAASVLLELTNTAALNMPNTSISPLQAQPNTLSEVDKLWELLSDFKSKIEQLGEEQPDIFVNKSVNRFVNVNSMSSTNVAPNLSANRVKIGEDEVAILTQYPKDNQIEDQLRMYLKEKIDHVTVLSSNKDIECRGLKKYFSPDCRTEEAVSVTSELTGKNELKDGTTCDHYSLNIRHENNTHAVKLLHVTNWPDHGVISSEDTIMLANEVEKHNKRVIHCTAGVGRTGVLAATVSMMKQQKNHISLQDVIIGLRKQRAANTVQTKDQLKLLAEIAHILNISILH